MIRKRLYFFPLLFFFFTEVFLLAQAGTAISNPPMNMAVNNSLPEGFRGGNTDKGVVHVLEDAKYSIQEHTVLYETDPAGVGAASGSTFAGPPTINWSTDRENADGEVETVSNDNNNSATNDNNFENPGIYRIHNNGSRQVNGGGQDLASSTSSADGSCEDTGSASDGSANSNGAANNSTPGGSGNASANGAANTSTPDGSGNASANGASSTQTVPPQRVNSSQSLTVISHDCTSPSLWAVFQEGAGSSSMEEDDEALREELAKQIQEASGTFDPASELKGALSNASLLAVFEFPKNARPEVKTSAVVVKGQLFDKDGRMVMDSPATVKMSVLDETEQTRLAEVTPENVKGIFVRRNVPFLAAVQMTDNGTYKGDSAEYWIENSLTGEKISKDQSAYLFRVPNFPREKYSDQPEYSFVVSGKDESGNLTRVKVPVYVVNTKTSLEGGKTE
ncbi:MAG: hypothetical protein HQM10_00785 [Candidatus Riflebacteria bacterium]|nr:hypothetical protein [Candidatus Riflebacteria bacterium]